MLILYFLPGCYDGRLRRLSSSTGAQMWSHAVGEMVKCAPAVVGDRVVFGAYDRKDHCLALDTGEKVPMNARTTFFIHPQPDITSIIDNTHK